MEEKKPSPVDDAASSIRVEDQVEEEWKPRRQEYLIMTTLSLISLMVALEASILTPSLPVSKHYPLL